MPNLEKIGFFGAERPCPRLAYERCHVLETARSLLPISAARRPPAVEACFLPCSSCDYLFPSKSFHPLNFLLRFLPQSLLQGGAAGFSVVEIAAELQATKPQSSGVARSMSYVC